MELVKLLPCCKNIVKQTTYGPFVCRPTGGNTDSFIMEPTLQSVLDMMQQMKGEMILQINAKIDSLAPTLEKIQNSLHTLGDQVEEVQQRVSTNEDNISELLERVKVLEKENTELKSWVENAENRSRRNNLRFIGIPEWAEAKDIFGFIRRLIPQLLGEQHFPMPPGIESCHRTGERSDDKGPRPILVKLQHFQDKWKIMQVARDKKCLLFKTVAKKRDGSTTEKEIQVHIYPDFSAGVTKKRREFDGIKKKLRERAIDYGLKYPSMLRVHHSGKNYYFYTPGEAEQFFNALPLTATEMETTE